MAKTSADPAWPQGGAGMNLIKRFVAFWYHFIVGDDWRIAVGVTFGLALTVYLTHRPHIQAWWLLPVLIITMLTLSLGMAARKQ